MERRLVNTGMRRQNGIIHVHYTLLGQASNNSGRIIIIALYKDRR